jgi:hypothetical protein
MVNILAFSHNLRKTHKQSREALAEQTNRSLKKLAICYF